MEGAHERQVLRGVREDVPAEERHDRLVDVHHVVVALAQRAAQRQHAAGRERDVRDGAVGGQPDGAPQRDEPRGRVQGLRDGAPVQTARERVGGVERCEDAGLVAGRGQLRSQGLDVPGHPAGIRPRIRRHKRYAHP